MKTTVLLMIFLFSSSFLLAANYSQPESVVYDQARNCYYISNVGVQGTFDGSIIKRSANGDTENLLNDNLYDPKGMYIVGDTLFVVDVYRLLYISLSSRQVLGHTIISTPDIFLNDIAADENGYLYLSEMSFGRIYRVSIANPTSFQMINFQGTLSSPNGLCFDRANNRMIITTFHSNANIMGLDLETMELSLLKSTSFEFFDGITRDKAGNYLVSSWGPLPMTPGIGKIYKFDSDFASEPTLFASDFDGPADIFMDTINNVLAVPNMGTNIVQFLMFGTNLNKPILASPVNNTTGVGKNITLRWLEVAGASSYTVQLSKSPAFNPTDVDSLVSNLSFIANNLDEASKYYWRVRANGEPAPSDWSDVWNFTINANTYEPPTLIAPINGKQYESSKPSFVWHSTTAGLYDFQLWSNPTLLGDPLVEIKNLTDTAINFKNDLPTNQTYYWRVKTFSGLNTSEYSDLWSFRVETFTYPEPVLLLPLHNATNVNGRPTFLWQSHEAGNYQLQISKFNNFTELTLDTNNLTDTTFTIHNDLQPLMRFYWRVRAFSETTGTWSHYFSFVTSDATSIEGDDSSLEISIYPNPATQLLQVNSPNFIIQSYELFSSQGKLIEHRNDLNTNDFSINANVLQNGEYFISMMFGNRKITKRFVISK